MDARLILDAPGEGAWNMAIDEALLESAAASGVASLRFYRWVRPTVSLGYFQRAADRALHAASLACPLVRRATGGGAIVHDRELTYSLCAPLTGQRRFDARSLYDAAHGALIDHLQRLGIAAALCESGGETAGQRPPFLCFQRRTAGDVLLLGAKIAGSAQRRRQGVVLQHGSLLLKSSESAPELAGVEDLVGQPMNAEELIRGWTGGLAKRLGLAFAASVLTPPELDRGNSLQAAKFDATVWSQRR